MYILRNLVKEARSEGATDSETPKTPSPMLAMYLQEKRPGELTISEVMFLKSSHSNHGN